jgi:hypothetical protein
MSKSTGKIDGCCCNCWFSSLSESCTGTSELDHHFINYKFSKSDWLTKKQTNQLSNNRIKRFNAVDTQNAPLDTNLLHTLNNLPYYLFKNQALQGFPTKILHTFTVSPSKQDVQSIIILTWHSVTSVSCYKTTSSIQYLLHLLLVPVFSWALCFQALIIYVQHQKMMIHQVVLNTVEC